MAFGLWNDGCNVAGRLCERSSSRHDACGKAKVPGMIQRGSRPASRSVMVVTVLLSVVGCAAFLEIVMRMLPISEGFRALAVNDANPVYRYAPNRAATWSKGWNFSITNRVRTNNVGFLSELGKV